MSSSPMASMGSSLRRARGSRGHRFTQEPIYFFGGGWVDDRGRTSDRVFAPSSVALASAILPR
eukprot:7156222-Pyramimonas_sp.AAC.1